MGKNTNQMVHELNCLPYAYSFLVEDIRTVFLPLRSLFHWDVLVPILSCQLVFSCLVKAFSSTLSC